MSVTNLKARPKAIPDRISESIFRESVIQNGKIVTNEMRHLAEPESLEEVLNLLTPVSVPLEFWLEHREQLSSNNVSVQIAADQSIDEIRPFLSSIKCVVLPFVTSVDGRSYSHAYQLRSQCDFQGEIRATGDVKHDNLGFLHRVGVTTFELNSGQDLNDALKAFTEFSQVYQPSADGQSLIFARRRALH